MIGNDGTKNHVMIKTNRILFPPVVAAVRQTMDRLFQHTFFQLILQRSKQEDEMKKVTNAKGWRSGSS